MAMHGARHLRRYPERCGLLKVEDPGVLLDIDVVGDLPRGARHRGA
ncbi:hypothetical protein [Halomonas sp. H10-9-1]